MNLEKLSPNLSEDSVPEVDPSRFIEFALRTIVATVRQYKAFARASRVMLDYKKRSSQFSRYQNMNNIIKSNENNIKVQV